MAAAVIAAGILLNSVAQASSISLMIDDYTAPQEVLHSGPGAHGPDSNTVLSAGILGGSRKLTLSSNVVSVDAVNSRIVSGVANYESGPISTGMQKYEYNGNGLGLGNLLSNVTMFSLDLTSFNAGTLASTYITLIANDGSDHVVGSHTLNDLSLVPQTLNFDPTGSGANFNALQFLRLDFDSTTAKGADFTVADFRATVPEPMLTNLVWIVALGGVGVVRAWRRK